MPRRGVAGLRDRADAIPASALRLILRLILWQVRLALISDGGGAAIVPPPPMMVRFVGGDAVATAIVAEPAEGIAGDYLDICVQV